MDVDLEHDQALAPGLPQAAVIQDAIERVHTAGGGTVSIGPGIWCVTTLVLRSGVELHLRAHATIMAHPELEHYPEIGAEADNKDQSPYHLLVAKDCCDVRLTGCGSIDGNDEAFWLPCEGEHDRPYGIFRYKVASERARPSPLIEFVRCQRLTIDGVSIRRSPGWALHVYDCDTVSIRGLLVRGHRFGPNTDGIGINGSRDVRISDCDVDTGDDAIIIKATNGELVCERVTVTNCVLASNCAAMGLGADVNGVIRDVVFSNCVVRQALRMIQVEMWFPGAVERALFSGITGRTFPDEGVTCERPIYVDIQQFIRDEPQLGRVKDLVFRDILCETRGRILMTAQDGVRIDGVTLDSVLLDVPEIEDPQAAVPAARSMQLSNFSPETRAVRAAVVADNVDQLVMRDVRVRWPAAPAVPMHAMCLRGTTPTVLDCPALLASASDVAHTLCLE